MNRSASRQRHDQARKHHKHEQQKHARDVARRPRPTVFAWVLGVGLAAAVIIIVAVSVMG